MIYIDQVVCISNILLLDIIYINSKLSISKANPLMHKTFSIDNMETYFRNYVPCTEHSNQPITNFCTQKICLKFMCPDCVERHSKTHANHPIQSIKTCIKKTNAKLNKAVEELQNEKKMHRILGFKDPQQYQQQLINELQEVRKGLITEINNYFKEKIQQVKRQTSKSHTITVKIKDIQNQLNKVISELRLLNKNLLVNQQSVHAIQKANKINYPMLLSHFQKKIQEIEKDMSFDIKVQTNPNKREDFRRALSNLIGIRNRYPQQQKSSDLHYNKLAGSRNKRKPQPYKIIQEENIKYDEHPQYMVNPLPLSADRLMAQAGFRIDIQNYFDTEPFLHFFEVSKSNLHVLKLKDLKQSEAVKWEIIPLNIKFFIPSFHRTVASESGNIYLIGGTNSETLEKSQTIYQYDGFQKSLIPVSALHIGRSSHSIVCHKKMIYIVGGMADQDQIPKKCQIFNTRTNETKIIASCKYATTNSTLCVLGEQNLIKLGGVDIEGVNSDYIEIYNIKADFWGEVDPTIDNIKGQFGLLSCSGWAPLNECQIFIFGGYNEQAENENSKMSFIFEYNKQDKQFYIKHINSKNLPLPEGFWNPQSVVYNSNIYALQNVDGEDEHDCLEDKRNVLVFNGKYWTVCYSE